MNNIQTVGATRGSPAIQCTTPVRKQIRLKSWDYSTSGWYFITICTQNRECLFGNIAVGATRGSPVTPTRGSPATIRRDRPIMVLNNNGNIVQNIWETLPNHHPVELDTFQIMPNHIHFIVHIIDAGGSRPIDAGGSRPAPTTTTLGTIIGLFKSECTKQIRRVTPTRGSPVTIVWQRNYYEHIIRTENDLNKIRLYIRENPNLWDRDKNNV